MSISIAKNLLSGKICNNCLYHEVHLMRAIDDLYTCGKQIAIGGSSFPLPKENTCTGWVK